MSGSMTSRAGLQRLRVCKQPAGLLSASGGEPASSPTTRRMGSQCQRQSVHLTVLQPTAALAWRWLHQPPPQLLPGAGDVQNPSSRHVCELGHQEVMETGVQPHQQAVLNDPAAGIRNRRHHLWVVPPAHMTARGLALCRHVSTPSTAAQLVARHRPLCWPLFITDHSE